VLNRDFNFLTTDTEPVFARNDEVYAYLRKAGLSDVYFADPGRRVHDKLLVIDGEWVLEGSHNWSHSALRLNRESSVLIRSQAYARFKEERIKGLKRVDPGEVQPGRFVKLDNAFLKDPRYLKRMVHQSDFRAMTLYLWLLYEGQKRETSELEIDLTQMADWAGLPRDWDENKSRRQLIKALEKKLEKRYGLIEVEIPHGQNAAIRLRAIESEEKGYVRLPAGFFEYGTLHRLSHAGLTAYLTALYLSETSPIRPWWQVPQEGWAALFGISPDVVQEGTRELRRLNLLEVIYFGFDQKPFYKDRPVNQYRLNELVRAADEAAEWDRLKRGRSAEEFSLARDYAAWLNDPADPRLVGRLLYLLDVYPDDWVREAMERMRKLQADNPRKHVQYVEGILEGFAADRVRVDLVSNIDSH